MSKWLVIFLLFAPTCFASPEYRDWLSSGVSENNLPSNLTFGDLIGDQQNLYSITVVNNVVNLPVNEETEDFAVEKPIPSNEILPRDFNSITPPVEETPAYLPPILNKAYSIITFDYFGLDLTFHVPDELVSFWSVDGIENQPVNDDFIRNTRTLISQIATLRQHYRWNDWELLRLSKKLGLELNSDIEIVLFQWSLMQSLGYEVQLGQQDGFWFLLFATKQNVSGYASVITDQIHYYIFPANDLLATTRDNLQHEDNLNVESQIVVRSIKNERPSQRLNLVFHKDAFYGNDWSELPLAYESGSIFLPISINRSDALIHSPKMSVNSYFNMEMPLFQSEALDEKLSVQLDTLDVDQKIDWLVNFVEDNLPDELENSRSTVAAALGIPDPQNMSYIRAYFLRQLMNIYKLGVVVAVEHSGDIAIAVLAPEQKDSKIVVNSKHYRILDRQISQKVNESNLADSANFKIIILN